MNPSAGLSLALKQAELAEHRLWRLGAVAFRGGALLTGGFNRTKNDPLVVDYTKCSVHAEADVLNQIDDPAGCVLYVGRITRGNKVGLARPCVRCMQAIADARVRKVVYTVDAHQFGFIKVGPYMEGHPDAEEICKLSTRHAKRIVCGRIAPLRSSAFQAVR